MGEKRATDGSILAGASSPMLTPDPNDASQNDGQYDDVMKMIEENRKRNEAKRAEQSKKNEAITRAYEERMAQNPTANHIFVYGSLRPDDNSRQPWTDEFISGMTARKATIGSAMLFWDSYPQGYAC